MPHFPGHYDTEFSSPTASEPQPTQDEGTEQVQEQAQSDQGTDQGTQEPTKEELYEQAQEQDVSGRSSMTKDELAEAVEAPKTTKKRTSSSKKKN